jgi:hypothetical protein
MREPDDLVGPPGRPFMKRWYIIPRNPVFNIYLHEFVNDDYDVPHSHPWWSLSFILKGSYLEHVNGQRKVREKWGLVLRRPETFHRIQYLERCWSIFLTGPRLKKWGFQTPNGYVDSETYKSRLAE